MRKLILNFFILFTLKNHSSTIDAQSIMCQKVDFNRDTSVINEFGECTSGEDSPNMLKINSYSDATISPFRPTSTFHLSAVIGFSCLRSTSIFTLDINSEIRTAIFLNWIDISEWVKVQLFNSDGDEIDVIAHLEESNGWTVFNVKVNRSVHNARIEISTNINTNGGMAMEYVYVLNSDLEDDECIDEDSESITTTTSPTTTTDEPLPTNDPTTSTSDEPLPTNDPTAEPNPTDGITEETDNESTTATGTTTTTPESSPRTQSIVYFWMSLSIVFFVTTILTSAGVCYFIFLYRRLQSIQPVTSGNIEMMKNLPRLQVKNSVNGDDPVIVAIDKL